MKKIRMMMAAAFGFMQHHQVGGKHSEPLEFQSDCGVCNFLE